jgi:hypothetical protein
MTATTVPCEQCGKQVPQSAVTYSTSGQRVCPACAATAVMASNADRAAVSRRNTRIALIVSAVLVVGVPLLMIAAGAGEYVATGLMIMGALLLFGGRSALRMSTDPGVRRSAVFLMLGGVGALVAGALLQGVFKHH